MTVPSATKPVPYAFGDLLIGGEWRAGHAGTTFKDVEPRLIGRSPFEFNSSAT